MRTSPGPAVTLTWRPACGRRARWAARWGDGSAAYREPGARQPRRQLPEDILLLSCEGRPGSQPASPLGPTGASRAARPGRGWERASRVGRSHTPRVVLQKAVFPDVILHTEDRIRVYSKQPPSARAPRKQPASRGFVVSPFVRPINTLEPAQAPGWVCACLPVGRDRYGGM